MQKIIKWFLWLLGFLGGLLMYAGQVPKNEFISNISTYIPFDNLPTWLTTQRADTWATIIGLSLVIIAICSFFIMRLTNKSKKYSETSKPQETNKPTLAIHLNTDNVTYGNYHQILAINVINTSNNDIDKECLVKLEKMDREPPQGLSLPLVLRTAGQIRGNRSGRFSLSSRENKGIPVVFRNPNRKNEWYIFDEQGNAHFIPAFNTKMVVGIYGGENNKKYTISFNRSPERGDFEYLPTLTTGQIDFVSTYDEDFQYFSEKGEMNGQPSLQPNIEMTDAYEYLASILFPDNPPNTHNVDKENPIIANLLTQKLRSGELRSWGLYLGESVERGFSREDWKYRELHPMKASIPYKNEAQTISVMPEGHPPLTGLRVNFNQVQTIWPKNKSAKLNGT